MKKFLQYQKGNSKDKLTCKACGHLFNIEKFGVQHQFDPKQLEVKDQSHCISLKEILNDR